MLYQLSYPSKLRMYRSARTISKLLLSGKPVLKLFQQVLKIAKLRLCFRARSLYLLHRLHHAFHHRRKVRHVEPERNDNNHHCIEYEFDDAAPERTPAHAVEHAVVFFGQSVDFFQLLFVGIHTCILAPLCPRQESNLDSRVRSAKFYPLNYGSVFLA